MEIDPKNLRIDVFHKRPVSGWSQQQPTAVRITHLPSGVWVEEFGDRSVHRNRTEAMHKMTLVFYLAPELFKLPTPPLTQHADLKAAWDLYRGDVELSVDDAFLFAAGFIAGRSK